MYYEYYTKFCSSRRYIKQIFIRNTRRRYDVTEKIIEKPINEDDLDVDSYKDNISDSVDKNIPMIETASVVETAPVVKTDPVVETASVVETDPVIETASIVETDPVVKTAPVVKTDPVVETAPVVETKPVVETAPVVETKPAFEKLNFKKPQPTMNNDNKLNINFNNLDETIDTNGIKEKIYFSKDPQNLENKMKGIYGDIDDEENDDDENDKPLVIGGITNLDINDVNHINQPKIHLEPPIKLDVEIL